MYSDVKMAVTRAAKSADRTVAKWVLNLVDLSVVKKAALKAPM